MGPTDPLPSEARLAENHALGNLAVAIGLAVSILDLAALALYAASSV